MRKDAWLWGVVLVAWVGAGPACDDPVTERDAGSEAPDAGPVASADIVFRIKNVGTCTVYLATSQKSPHLASSIMVEQGDMRGPGFPNCACPVACIGNDYLRTIPIKAGESLDIHWAGLLFWGSTKCETRPIPFGPVAVRFPYFALADESARYTGPDVRVTQTFDYSPDGGVVEFILNPPQDRLANGSPGVCP
ncbi:hypothetical protein [Myxococcus stipitatus]|uniref:hypothetical protein n=1 Tax=Myxococcus stipitatus TaxID=83455 RepID=UPI0030D59940